MLGFLPMSENYGQHNVLKIVGLILFKWIVCKKVFCCPPSQFWHKITVLIYLLKYNWLLFVLQELFSSKYKLSCS